MAKPTTCGHEGYYAKDLCQRCYNAARAESTREHRTKTSAKWRAANRERHAAAQASWRQANAEHKAEYARKWTEANSERADENRKRWRAANKAREYEKLREWRAANPDAVAAQQSRRRALRYGNNPDLTVEQWQAILVEFDHRCAYCNVGGVPMEMEHMTPLSRGGRHTASNVVPSCGPCNRSKHMRTALEWIGPEWRPDVDR
jgi:hypothetical protein